MTDTNSTACFSGHRILRLPSPDLFVPDQGDASPGDFYRLISESVEKAIYEMIEKGKTRFICGMADGFDLLAGMAALRVKRSMPSVKLICAVPFTGQARRYPEDERKRYEQILNEADERHILSQDYTPDCFHKRNDYMVANSSALICWYDGTPGGTAYTVKSALRKGLAVCNLFNNAEF